MTVTDLNVGTIPEWEIGDRMRKALQTARMNSTQMADYLGVTRETVSTWINSRHAPSNQTVMLWALRTGVPYEWIATGCTPRDLNPEPTDSGFVFEAIILDFPSTRQLRSA